MKSVPKSDLKVSSLEIGMPRLERTVLDMKRLWQSMELEKAVKGKHLQVFINFKPSMRRAPNFREQATGNRHGNQLIDRQEKLIIDNSILMDKK